MKRESVPRQLRMGCGETLIARVARAVIVNTTRVAPGSLPKDAVQRAGKDKR